MKTFRLKNLIKLVYPDELCCCVCGAEVFDGSELCDKCKAPIVEHYCKICGAYLKNENFEYCNDCLKGDRVYYFNASRGAYYYGEESIKKAIWKLKYKKARYVAHAMAKAMAKVYFREKWDVDLITYVPLHPKKERLRTYNQAQLLANELSEIIGKPVMATLNKLTYSNTSVTSLGKQKREELLQGSFGLVGENLKDKKILIVDDVMTTSATMNECSKMLRLAKADKIYSLTVAISRGDTEPVYEIKDETKNTDLMKQFDED